MISTLRHLLPAVFAGCFLGFALGGVEAVVDPPSIWVFAVIYLALGTALHGLLLAAQGFGKLATLAAAAAVAVVLVWHVRELTYRPAGLVGVLLVAFVAALPIAGIVLGGEVVRRRTALAVLALGGVATFLGVVVAFEGSELLRWHLLRHHKLLGTPAYYLLAENVQDLEDELFAPHRPGAGPPPAEEAGPEGDGVPERPNLVYLMLDTLRADALELGGGRREKMPLLNAYLDGAHRFTNVMANASWTRPSVASLLTGLLPEAHGARDTDEPLEAGFTTLAERLQVLGYETIGFQSNVGAAGRAAGFAQGFDVFYEFPPAPYARAERIRHAALSWLEEREASSESTAPLFLYLHFLDPHEPYRAGVEPAHKSFAEYEAAYDAELAYLDKELALLLDALEERLPGDTAVFVVSDHGEEFGEHEEFGHGYALYPESVHIPAAFHVGDGGGSSGAALEGRDFFDLLVGWASSSPDGNGFDVAAWAAERDRASRYTSLYYSSTGRLLLRPYLRNVTQQKIEHDGYRLLWSAYGDTYELYDVESDPGEQHNLAAERPEIVERLKPLLKKSVSSWHFPAPYEPSPEELEQLRSLGYIDG